MGCNEKISIVLPVYNSEKSIENCIKSVVNQNYLNYELIIVNDGSCDRTTEILSGFKQNTKIKIISKNNGGVSSARNAGLKVVSGSYLMFLDSDDLLLEKSLERLNEIIQEHGDADVIIYGWKENSKLNDYRCMERSICLESQFIDKNDCIKNILTTEYECGGGFPWNKIWKTESLFGYSEIPLFDEKLILCEDKEWTVRALLKINKVFLSEQILYNYIIQEGEHLSRIDFNKNSKHGNKKIISFMNATVLISENINGSLQSEYLKRLTKSKMAQDIIMVCYKSKINKNNELLIYTMPIYNNFVKGKRIKVGLKYQIMKFFLFI